MKRSSVFRPVVTGSRAACLFASAIAALLATTAVQAATLYWDLNQDTANDAGPLTGTWDGINVYWNSDSSGTGGTPTATTTAADDLVFSSGSVYTAGTVTTEGSQAASSLTFKDNIAVTLAGTLVQNATPVSADNATDTFSYTGTAVQDGEVVSFGGTPPAGLIAGQIYYIINSTAGTYQVANTAGGAAIDFTDDGDSVTNTVQTTLALGGSGTYKGIIVSAGNSTISAPVSLTANISYTFQVAAGASLTQSGSVTTPGGGATDTQINKTGTGTMNFTGGMFSSSSTGVRRLQVSEGIANFTNSNVYLSHFGKGSSNNAYITATNSSINTTQHNTAAPASTVGCSGMRTRPRERRGETPKMEAKPSSSIKRDRTNTSRTDEASI